MKNVFAVLGILGIVGALALPMGQAAPIGTNPNLDRRLNRIEANSWVTTARINSNAVTEAKLYTAGGGAAAGLGAKRIAKVKIDCTVSGACDVGAHGLGVTLPASSIITRSWLEIAAQFTDTGSCSVAVSCEDANNIKTATDLSGSAAAALIEGESTGAASAFKTGIAAACEITNTVATFGATTCSTNAAGKANVWVEYVVGG